MFGKRRHLEDAFDHTPEGRTFKGTASRLYSEAVLLRGNKGLTHVLSLSGERSVLKIVQWRLRDDRWTWPAQFVTCPLAPRAS